MRLYLVRDGDPDYSIDSLTPAGHQEAQALAERMASTLRPTHLFCSPAQRARHTCQHTEQKLGMTAQIEPWTAELSKCRQAYEPAYEPWGSLCIWDCPGERVRAAYPLPTRDNWHEMPEFSNPLWRESLEMVGRSRIAG